MSANCESKVVTPEQTEVPRWHRLGFGLHGGEQLSDARGVLEQFPQWHSRSVNGVEQSLLNIGAGHGIGRTLYHVVAPVILIIGDARRNQASETLIIVPRCWIWNRQDATSAMSDRWPPP